MALAILPPMLVQNLFDSRTLGLLLAVAVGYPLYRKSAGRPRFLRTALAAMPAILCVASFGVASIVNRPSPVPYLAEYRSVSGFVPRAEGMNRVEPDQVLHVRVAVKNTGTYTWQRSFRPVGLGVCPGTPPSDEQRRGAGPIRVVSYNAEPTGCDDMNRFPLRAGVRVGPNGIAVFEGDLKMPHNPGVYNVTLQMVIDGPVSAPPSSDGWFAGPVLMADFRVRDLEQDR